jgi:hypothetical protein
MTKKILISDHKEIAEKHIQTLKTQAAGMTELIKTYNSLPVLRPIETREQVKEFLEHPVEFLNNAVIKDTGITFSAKAKPLPEQVAAIFGIPHDKFIQQLSRIRIGNLEYMKFDQESLTIEFDPDCEKTIFEEFKEYARSEEEAAEILKCRELCKGLNEWCDRYGISPSDMNIVADRIGLKCEVKPDGHGWELKEHISFIRNMLEYEQIHNQKTEQ